MIEFLAVRAISPVAGAASVSRRAKAENRSVVRLVIDSSFQGVAWSAG